MVPPESLVGFSDKRNPAIAEMEHAMADDEAPQEGCSRTASDLDRHGFAWASTREPLEGTRRVATWLAALVFSVSDTHSKKMAMLSGQTAANPAHLRSLSGRNAGVAKAHPTGAQHKILPHLFRVLLLERMHLPLPVTEKRAMGATLSSTHEESTKLHARVRFNGFLRDMNVGVRADDDRRIEVLAQDLSALQEHGELTQTQVQGRSDKETACPELVESGWCRQVAVATETGGLVV